MFDPCSIRGELPHYLNIARSLAALGGSILRALSGPLARNAGSDSYHDPEYTDGVANRPDPPPTAGPQPCPPAKPRSRPTAELPRSPPARRPPRARRVPGQLVQARPDGLGHRPAGEGGRGGPPPTPRALRGAGPPGRPRDGPGPPPGHALGPRGAVRRAGVRLDGRTDPPAWSASSSRPRGWKRPRRNDSATRRAPSDLRALEGDDPGPAVRGRGRAALLPGAEGVRQHREEVQAAVGVVRAGIGFDIARPG